MIERRVWPGISGGLSLFLVLPAVLLARPLAAQAGDSTGKPGTYHLIHDSRLEVKTGKSGVFGFAGHDHLIRATAYDGEVKYEPEEPAATSIRIRIVTDGLKVLTPPDSEEIRKVTASMRGEVLDVDRYPEIRFASKSVTRAREGYTIVADLTMHGQTHEVTVPAQVGFSGDTLVAKSRFRVKQTAFGMKPYRGGPAGSIRVADEVEFRIQLRAVR
jgi:polyisoprenoid-binding protein YceI